MAGFRRALIVGAGNGLSAALARRFAAAGMELALAARGVEKLAALCAETGAVSFAADAAEPEEVAALFEAMDAAMGPADVVVYNASFRVRGPFETLDAAAVARTLAVTAYGAFLVAQQAVRRMLPGGHGAVLLTGASAGVKGYPQSAPFAMGKFALRGLAQSMARELSPKGIHVAHFVIDGGIRAGARAEPAEAPDSLLDPAAIAETYWHVLNQPRSAWSWEVELRPWVERF
jgi:NAD(P)-dependent dehydrogenase (short-subunit alcohol dehydrogenase family)